MKHVHFFLVLIVLLCLPAAAPAEPAAAKHANAIDSFVLTQMRIGQIPGLALAILEDGEVTYIKCYGAADDAGTPVTEDTPFATGSVGKSFTALCIRQLIAQGKMSEDDPVTKYLPWFTLKDADGAGEITILHLLTHRSGLSTFDGVQPWTYRHGLSREAAVRRLADVSPAHAAGMQEEYSNLNYMILGLLVEKVSGMPFETYVAEHVFRPLAMDHTFASRKAAGNAPLAQGHHIAFGLVLPDGMAEPTAQVPAGFQYASARDMAAYARLILHNGYQGGQSIIENNPLAQLSEQPERAKISDKRYTMYWLMDIGPIGGNGYHGHAGADSGFTTSVNIHPMTRRAVVVLANCRNDLISPSVDANTIAFDIASILNTGKPSQKGPYTTPDLAISLFMLAAAVLLPVIRLLFAPRFAKGIKAGGPRRWLAVGSFILIDILLPVAIVLLPPVSFVNTWRYLLNAGPSMAIPLLILALLLLFAGAVKVVLLLKMCRRSNAAAESV